jgi:plasmid stabilization system protein ParE
MAISIAIHEDAKHELDAAIGRIAADRPVSAAEFLHAVRRALEILREYPLAGKQLGRSRFRQFVIDGWRHSVIYASEDDGIRVFAFAHHSRKPRYWRKRAAGSS